MSPKPAAFIDRDGVINVDRGYVYQIEDFEILPGVPEALRLLRSAGFLLILVTNQSGIGRGYYSETDLLLLHAHLQNLLAEEGASFDGIYYCPHHPDHGCDCRKPLPGLILEAMRDFPLDRGRSFIAGDNPSDLAAGGAAGLGHGYLIAPEGPITSLLECARVVLS